MTMTKKTQRQMYDDTLRRSVRLYKVFLEIQQGPFPLSLEQMEKLLEMRPGIYGFLEAWIKKEKNEL